MDFNQRYRTLPYVGVLKESVINGVNDCGDKED